MQAQMTKKEARLIAAYALRSALDNMERPLEGLADDDRLAVHSDAIYAAIHELSATLYQRVGKVIHEAEDRHRSRRQGATNYNHEIVFRTGRSAAGWHHARS